LRGAVWSTDPPFRETTQTISAAVEDNLLAVEMEAAALYAFAHARHVPVVCLAHVTNRMTQVEGFVLHFSEALEIELKGRGVQVMAVCPGPTATSFFEGVSTKMKGVAFDSAEMVVSRTLRSFDQKKSVAYPGRFSGRVATWLPRLLPRSVVVSVAASATGKMGLAS